MEEVKPSLTTQAFQKIESMILRNELQQGQIISEIFLQKKLGIGRTPVHEALILLSEKQMVSIIPRKGVMVSVITLDTINDIFTARRLIEPTVLATVADKLDRQWLTSYREQFIDIYQGKKLRTIDEIVESQKVDMEFHVGLIAALHNQYLNGFVSSYYSQLIRINVVTTSKCMRSLEVSSDHIYIIDHLLNNDTVAAVDLLKTHLQSAYHDVLESFQRGVSLETMGQSVAGII